ncbi:Hypothetical_protein [Hexamita inflata]|uniref:Hypothetical_protein n=1 Tax=Hexamita inflata TaxID=28002 RepID=A0AA86QC66_9EUKA|nr:Hypothetical protein HINF_LOCUS37075 [Hexamita inflata]
MNIYIYIYIYIYILRLFKTQKYNKALNNKKSTYIPAFIILTLTLDCASRSSSFLRRLNKIGCGRQNFPAQSAELPSRICIAKGIPSTNLHHCFLRNVGRSASTVQPRYALGCLYQGAPNIGVSKTNDHSRGLTVSSTED